ncbi:MAG TPA: hypothetical protein PKW98_14315 [Candidatus Wallbacteria bacterium]|nr:hypothetical protein [Candidatus Wallbacteria bacterium]
MEGFEVNTVEATLGRGDIYVTTTGNKDVLTLEHMQGMKDQAIVCNIGHFDNEIQVDRLNNSDAVKLNIKPQIHSDTEVTIDLNIEVSSLLDVTDDGQIHRGTRKTDTIVRLKDNNTAVFGGIIKQDERTETIKVPLLGDIPRLGRLSSHVSKTRVDTELIMLITPHITPFDMPRRDEKDDGVNEIISSSFQY